MSFKIELGSKVRDKVTGFEGIVWARSEWLYGCRRYTIQSQTLKDGKPIEPHTVDEDAIEVLTQAEPHTVKSTGGDRNDVAPKANESRV